MKQGGLETEILDLKIKDEEKALSLSSLENELDLAKKAEEELARRMLEILNRTKGASISDTTIAVGVSQGLLDLLGQLERKITYLEEEKIGLLGENQELNLRLLSTPANGPAISPAGSGPSNQGIFEVGAAAPSLGQGNQNPGGTGPDQTPSMLSRLNRNQPQQLASSISSKWHKIHGVEAANPKVLVAINVSSQGEQDKLIAEGLPITSRSGMQFLFKKDEGDVPKAILRESDAPRIPEKESDDDYNYRMGQTIVDMINNVLSKGDVVKINTKDPVKGEIARLYIDHLKETHKLDYIKFESNVNLIPPDDKIKATAVFESMMVNDPVRLTGGPTEQPSWYQQHLEETNHSGRSKRSDDDPTPYAAASLN